MGRKREPTKRDLIRQATLRRLVAKMTDEELDRQMVDTSLTPEEELWWIVREEREARDADAT